MAIQFQFTDQVIILTVFKNSLGAKFLDQPNQIQEILEFHQQ